jgi:pyruvate,water dikinase
MAALAARFEAPGPGWWTLDAAHFPQPATRFVIELFPEPARRGFADASARYGVLMDHIEWAFVHGWAYLCPRPAHALGPDPAREHWDRLVASNPSLRERLARSAGVFTDRRWREDVTSWDEETRPRMNRGHRALQAVAADALPVPELLSYLERCRENLRQAIYEHHRLNIGPVIPVGDFLAAGSEWTGLPAGELVGLVRGRDGPSVAAGAELARLAAVVREDGAAAALLSSADDPGAVLARLAALPGPAGSAASAYLNLTAWWSAGSGFDVSEPCLSEMPHLQLATIRAAVDGAEPAVGAGAALARVRAAVPPARRQAFDDLLGEARLTHRLRDERALYCDVWAYGLMRRAIIAAGRRLSAAGAIEDPCHLLEAGYGEMRSLVEGGREPAREELAARARARSGAAAASDAPPVLGGPPPTPVPLEWLGPGEARTERAFRIYMRAMSGEEAQTTSGGIGGTPASPGRYQGRARIVRAAADLGRIARGDVLVTSSTTPVLSSVLPLLGAIVTDRGGLLSHAAIVAREFGIPAVVGTGEATTKIRDGALVVVDGETGQVTLPGGSLDQDR